MWSEYRCEIDSQTSAFTEKLGQNKNNEVKGFFLFLPPRHNHTVSYFPLWGGGSGRKTFKTYHTIQYVT